MTLRPMLAVILALGLASSGCAFLLPVRTDETDSRWESFEEAKQAFDLIETGQTTREDLGQLGYDPYSDPNVEILNYLNVLERLLPENPFVPIPESAGVQACIEAVDRCNGLALQPSWAQDKEEGVALLSVLSFRRQNELTGWHFTSLVVLVDDEVVYKLWSGNPGTLQHKDHIQPLGPFQNIDLNPF